LSTGVGFSSHCPFSPLSIIYIYEFSSYQNGARAGLKVEGKDMTDPDSVVAAMRAQWLSGDYLSIDLVPVEPVANVLREVILDQNPENSKAPTVSLEAKTARDQRSSNNANVRPLSCVA
jgi:hypothetical protein